MVLMRRARARRRRGDLARLCRVLFALAWIGAAPRITRAEEPSAGEADALFHRAGAAYDAGDFARAHDLYTSAFEKKKTHDIAAMLAQTELKLGRLCDADAHLDAAVAALPPSLVGEHRERVVRARAEVKQRIGSVRIEVQPATASVQIDFRPVRAEALAAPVCVAAGDHTVFVAAPGFAVERRLVTVEPGRVASVLVELRRVRLEIDLGRGPATTRARAGAGDASQIRADPLTPVAFGGLFMGLGAVVTGAVLLPIGLDQVERANSLYSNLVARAGKGAPCSPMSDYRTICEERAALESDGVVLANAGLTSILAGVAVGAAAGTFLILRPPIAGAGPGGPRVTVGAARDGAFIALRGSF